MLRRADLWLSDHEQGQFVQQHEVTKLLFWTMTMWQDLSAKAGKRADGAGPLGVVAPMAGPPVVGLFGGAAGQMLALMPVSCTRIYRRSSGCMCVAALPPC
jgi:hypothetical protein